MRVLMLSWEYPPHVVGGLGKHVAELVPALAGLGIDVHLLTPRWGGGETRERANGVTIYRLDPPRIDSGDFFATVQMANTIVEEMGRSLLQSSKKYDLIHVHDWLMAFASFELKRDHKIPLLSTIHATERGRNRGELHSQIQVDINDVEWRLVYESWRVICCSQYMAREVKDYFSTPPDKIDVIPNGIATQQFDELNGVDLSDFRSRFAEPSEKIVFYVGRLVYEKGLQVLVEAAPLILAQYPDAKFVIAGTGGMLDSLRIQAKRLGVDRAFHFTGFISDSDRNRLFKIADCAVFPSLYEPFGIVALEAMAAKTPVVVAETGGLTEVVEHGETGITVYPGSAESLAWGILHTLERPQWAKTRVDNAYQKVISEYNWDYIARQTKVVYDQIITERKAVVW